MATCVTERAQSDPSPRPGPKAAQHERQSISRSPEEQICKQSRKENGHGKTEQCEQAWRQERQLDIESRREARACSKSTTQGDSHHEQQNSTKAKLSLETIENINEQAAKYLWGWAPKSTERLCHWQAQSIERISSIFIVEPKPPIKLY